MKDVQKKWHQKDCQLLLAIEALDPANVNTAFLPLSTGHLLATTPTNVDN